MPLLMGIEENQLFIPGPEQWSLEAWLEVWKGLAQAALIKLKNFLLFWQFIAPLISSGCIS